MNLKHLAQNKNSSGNNPTQASVKLIILDSAFASFKKLASELAENKFGISSFIVDTALGMVRKKLCQILDGYDLFKLEPWKEGK